MRLMVLPLGLLGLWVISAPIGSQASVLTVEAVGPQRFASSAVTVVQKTHWRGRVDCAGYVKCMVPCEQPCFTCMDLPPPICQKLVKQCERENFLCWRGCVRQFPGCTGWGG